MYIDTHSHIYLEQFAADHDAMLRRAAHAGIKAVIMPAIDASTHQAMLEAAEKTTVKCISMMGLHPCSVNDKLADELRIVEQHLQQGTFAAIGETGLDFYWDLTYKNAQYKAFEQQIEWAITYNLPVVIHSRESIDECIEVVRQYRGRGLTGVFHCFGGSLQQANAIIDNGFYLGIGGIVTFKKSGLDEVLKHVPPGYIVLETDAPYLAPAPYRGKRNEPAYIPYIAQKIAEIKNIAIEEVAAITTKNAEKLFRMEA